jgi:hypothetical protein
LNVVTLPLAFECCAAALWTVEAVAGCLPTLR